MHSSLFVFALGLASSPPNSGLELYYVDLEKALDALPAHTEGQKALKKSKDEAEKTLASIEKEAVAIRKRLESTGDAALMQKYSDAADRYEKTRKSLETELQKSEDELRGPLLARLKAAMQIEVEGVTLVSLDEHPIAAKMPHCDRTQWLAQRVSNEKQLKRDPKCRVNRLLYFDPKRVFKESELSKKANERIEQMMKANQAELDREQRKVQRLERAGDRKAHAAASMALADRFGVLQAQLEEKEDEEADAIYAAIYAAVGRGAKKGDVFLELTEAPKLAPSCDVTAWVIEMVDGNRTAKPPSCKPVP